MSEHTKSEVIAMLKGKEIDGTCVECVHTYFDHDLGWICKKKEKSFGRFEDMTSTEACYSFKRLGKLVNTRNSKS
jgi:hypothetical protein